MINGFILIIGMTCAGALGGFYFKKASMNKFLINLLMGGCFYLLGAGLNIMALRYLQYSIVYPLTSITYVWTLVISYFFLKETITKKKIFGVLFIFLGSCILMF